MRTIPVFRICGFAFIVATTGCSDTRTGPSPRADDELAVLAQELGANKPVASNSHLSVQCSKTEDAPPPVGDRRIPFMPANDVQFIDYFVEHHRDAVEMADMVIERGSAADVKSLAQQVRDAQTKEIKELQATRRRLTGNTTPVPLPHDSHMMSEMEHMRTLSGAELDYDFLEEMIPHHGSGITPARHAVPHLCRFNLVRMAVQIYSDQAEEIGQMIDLLIQRAGAPVPAHHLDVGGHEGADIGLVGDRRVTFTPLNDVEFIDFFVPHHEEAVMMAKHVAHHGRSPEVRALADSVVQGQSEEIATMKAVRSELIGSPEPNPPPKDPMMESMMQHMMKASGVVLDVMFLVEMIPHHASGLGPAHRARPHLTDDRLLPIADAIYTTQSKEIGEMREMLLHRIWSR